MNQPSNARFLPGHPDRAALLRDLREGLRYTYGGAENVLPWDTTYLDIAQLPFVKRLPHDRFGWPVFRFGTALRLGSLEIGSLQINVPDPERQSTWRLDVPPDLLPFEVRLRGGGEDNYWQLKTYFGPALGIPINCWEREDQLHTEWEADGLRISVTYWFKSNISKEESGFAALTITNERIFPRYFTDAYVDSFWPDQLGLTVGTFHLPHGSLRRYYRMSHWVRFTPQALRQRLRQEKRHLAVWHDPHHGKLGFAKDEELCIIIDSPEHQRFVLQLIDMDRGQYLHELQVGRPDGSGETVLSAGVGALEDVVELLEKTGLRVAREN